MNGEYELVAALGVLIPIVALIGTAAVIIALIVYRYRERTKLHDTLRALSATDSAHQSELIAALTRASVATPERDLRSAIVLFGVTAGILAMAFLIGLSDGEAYEVIWPLVAIAIFPFAFGVGRLFLWRMALRRGEG